MPWMSVNIACFTILCMQSGLRARKSESNTGDATVSLRILNEEEELTLYKFYIMYYAHSLARCYKVTISLVSNVGCPFIRAVSLLLAGLTVTALNIV